ncbi:hypothetical protein KKP3000_001309 [Alicyclobacillus fastidiosus]|uniref:Uncharacterized protein n=1 Tax=Alicyclobacillus fastidiosus TaxID=392011 RepID=A0ABV5A9B5_9BACL|nr:hypothetical protein [Alicyclobacillus fastidiosus]WEH12006.1 hypothetical protein PYS47_06110 [Alicyclobacillus fastidiosus]
MPVLILSGSVNSNTPQQNAGVFVGQVNMGGWDANEKESVAQSGIFGFFSVTSGYNILNDNFEFIDGMINDQDLKISYELNV